MYLVDRIMLKRIVEEVSVKCGNISPDSAREKEQQGEVIAVGDGKITNEGKRIPLDVKVGDRIIWSKYSGTDLPVKIDDQEYLIVREEEVLGIIEAAKHAASGGKK